MDQLEHANAVMGRLMAPQGCSQPNSKNMWIYYLVTKGNF